METTIGIAIVGTGAIAKSHIIAYQTFSESCSIRALCDIYPEKAKALASEMGLEVDVYADYHEMLKRTDIQVVSICLPPSVHAEVSIASMDAKKHVLVEKPMAPSLAECDAMIEASQRNNVVFSPVAQNRFRTPMMRLKTMLDSKVAGNVLHATINSLWWRGQNYYDLWWRGTWEKECGGCTTSHAVHQLDLMQWMLGMPQEVTAVMANVGHDNSECEDLAIAIFSYPGMLAQMTASIVAHDEGQELVFQTEQARLSAPWNVAASKALENGFPEDDAETAARLDSVYGQLPSLEAERHVGQVKNFLAAIRGEEPLLIDGPQGRNTMELIMAVYKASVTKTTVRLPIEKDDPLYTREGLVSFMPHFHEKKRSVENFATSEITLGKDAVR